MYPRELGGGLPDVGPEGQDNLCIERYYGIGEILAWR